MKAKEVKIDAEFTPFTLEITLETPEEARLLWHVFNRLRLRDAIFDDEYGVCDGYNDNIDSRFSDIGMCKIIGEHVKL